MLRYVEINENKVPIAPFKTKEDKEKYSKTNCESFPSASLIIPNGVVILDFDEDNILKISAEESDNEDMNNNHNQEEDDEMNGTLHNIHNELDA